jgi:hypothetical protein
MNKATYTVEKNKEANNHNACNQKKNLYVKATQLKEITKHSYL